MLISVAARHLHAIKHSVTRGAGVLCTLHATDFMQAALATSVSTLGRCVCCTISEELA